MYQTAVKWKALEKKALIIQRMQMVANYADLHHSILSDALFWAANSFSLPSWLLCYNPNSMSFSVVQVGSPHMFLIVISVWRDSSQARECMFSHTQSDSRLNTWLDAWFSWALKIVNLDLSCTIVVDQHCTTPWCKQRLSAKLIYIFRFFFYVFTQGTEYSSKVKIQI